MKKDEFKIIIVFLKDELNKDKVCLFFDELLDCKHDEKNNLIIYKTQNVNIDVSVFLDQLDEDFDGTVSLFESNIIDNDSNSNLLINMYKNKTNKHKYESVVTLINGENIVKIKSIILKKINEDNELMSVILSMFKNNLNVSKTATDVYMHRNTVINKLEIIKKYTGLDMQKFTDAYLMYKLLKD